jgi:hypothetical protein
LPSSYTVDRPRYTRAVCQNIIYEHYYYYYYYYYYHYYYRPPPAPSPVVYTVLCIVSDHLFPSIYCSMPNSDNFPTRLSRLNWFVNETACHSKTVYNLNKTRKKNTKKWFKTNVIYIAKRATVNVNAKENIISLIWL